MEHILRIDQGKDFVDCQETFAKKFKKLLFDPQLVEYFKKVKTKTIVSFLSDSNDLIKGDMIYGMKVEVIIQKREAKQQESISKSLGFKQTWWFQVQMA